VKGAAEAARREARLARALRENLRRRKDQARARADEGQDPCEASAAESPSSTTITD